MKGEGEFSEKYAAAGVNTALAGKVKKNIARWASITNRPEVLSGVGFFGGLFELKGYREPVLVSSVDGVGTKLRLAAILGKHSTVGMDIVNHCVNDIFTSGAEPLFFLDYIGMGKLVPEIVDALAQGMANSCRDAGCALIGGETAEMPGMYTGEDYDLVGFIIGVVEKARVTMGQTISPGDILIGLPSSGLHTNGYSLVRKVFGEDRATYEKYYPELGRTLGEALLEPHRSYLHLLKPHLSLIRGMAHITGGGLEGNVPRILPEGVAARFHRKAWIVPPIFRLIQKQGNIPEEEMFRVFNMGIGMVVACTPDDARKLTAGLPEARPIGDVVERKGGPAAVIE